MTHPTTLTSVVSLAALLQSQGRLAEAEPLMRRDLAVCEEKAGPDHETTLVSANTLGGLLYAMYQQAHSHST